MFKNKFMFGAFIVFATISSIASGIRGGEALSGASTTGGQMTLDQLLRRDADAHNRRKGEKIGDATFDRAYVTGRTLVVEFIMENAPRRIDTSATSARLEARMKSQFCNSSFAAVMRRGGGLVYAYSTPGGSPIVDARIDAATCKLS